MKRMTAVLALAVAALGATGTACITTPVTLPDRDAGAAGTPALRAAQAWHDAGSIRSRPEVFEGACDITASVGAFRTALGTLNPNQPGSFGSGRREINWDAVPAQFTNVDHFPADFFNQPAPGRARGVVFSTPGSGFRTSDNNLADLNPTYADQFDFFSPVRTFIAVGDNVTFVQFFVPGSGTPATSTGFGVVFSDIDHPGSGMLRLFDAAGRNLGTYLAPACPGGLSFVGVRFPEPIVARVEIVSGQAALGPESFDVSSRDRGPARDLVIMDDFLYGEPIASPVESGTEAGASLR
jgi:hypothetical protein